jgi:hypothetical protein
MQRRKASTSVICIKPKVEQGIKNICLLGPRPAPCKTTAFISHGHVSSNERTLLGKAKRQNPEWGEDAKGRD